MPDVSAEQIGVLSDNAEASEPRVPAFAKVVELVVDGGRVLHRHPTEGLEGRLRQRPCEQARLQFLDPFGVGADDGGLLGGEVVEEGPRRDVSGLGDVLDGDALEATLGHELQGRVPQCQARRLLLPVAAPSVDCRHRRRPFG